MKPAKRKRNIPMCAAGILFCLTMITLHMVSGLYAKYITTGSTVDAARTAAFYLKAEGTLMQHLQSEIIPGGDQTQPVVIFNQTEVSMKYTMVIRKVTDNLPLRMELITPNGGKIDPTNDTFTVSETLHPRDDDLQREQYTLVLHWDVTDLSIEPDTNLDYMGMLDYFTVTVEAEQVD